MAAGSMKHRDLGRDQEKMLLLLSWGRRVARHFKVGKTGIVYQIQVPGMLIWCMMKPLWMYSRVEKR